MTKSKLTEIKHRLNSVSQQNKLLFLLQGMNRFLISSAATIFFVVMMEYLFEFDSVIRTILFIVILIIIAGAFVFFIFPPLIKFAAKHDRFQTAQMVGKKYPMINDELLNALQLLEMKNSNYSETLIEAAFNRIFEKTQFIDFNKIVDFRNAFKQLGISLLIFVLFSIALFTIPGLRSASIRLLNFNKDYIAAPKSLFTIQPGNASVTKDENVTISVDITGSKPRTIILNTKTAEQIVFSPMQLAADSLDMFAYQVKNIKSSFEYFVYAEGLESEKYKITVIDRPVINKLEIEINPPAYSAVSPSFQKDNGNITTLVGSRLTLNIASTKSLVSAYITFSDSSQKYFTVNSNQASINFTTMKTTDYFITLIDDNGNRNAEPILYNITTISDEYPNIEIITPEKEIQLTADNKINITAKIDDDFGFTKLNLNYRLSASKYEDVWPQMKLKNITINTNVKEDNIYYVWNLEELVLAEGDAVTYYLELFDNDIVSGPKSTKSETLTLRVPSIDDLFGDLDNSQENAAGDLDKMLDNAKDLQKEFEKLSNELKQDTKDISWEEKEKIEKAVKGFEEMSGKMEDIKKQIADLQKDAMQNNLLSEETLEKYNELQKLMDELGSDELSEAFKKMQEMLQQLSRSQVQESFEDMKANEKLFQKSIERTINLLKRIQVEQKIDELVKRTEELSETIKETAAKTAEDNLDSESSKELAKRQNDITQKIDNLDDVMNDLQNKMSELNDMPLDEMKKLMEEFQKQLNEEISKGAEQNLKMQNKSEAMQNQQKLSENINSLSDMLKSLQQSIQQQNQMQVLYDMLKIIDNLLLISKEEEELKNSTQALPPFSTGYLENAQKQSKLIDNLDKVTEQMVKLSQKTFAITPEMGKALGEARGQMLQAITFLQNRLVSIAPQMQTKAMSLVNEAAVLMKSAMDMLMNSGGQGGGMMSMMQQLQKMSQQQMNLNQLTKMLNQGTLSQQQMAQLQRLANEQALIKKSLEQLNRENKQSGESKKLASNLEKIIAEMDEVVKNMSTSNIDDQVIQKQERILSRLLDAQRSMNERDYDEKRESQTGTNIAGESPGEIDLSSKEGRDKLRDELIRALKEGYKKDYEDLIRKYFEALEKEEQK